MVEQMKWEDIYELWKRGCYHFPDLLTEPVDVETVYVKNEREGCCIYGYDWLENEAAQDRKELIRENPIEFLYFTKHSNKGTIQTAEMLVEARDEEELAAVWIAATAKELSDYRLENGIGYCAEELYTAVARGFLEKKYYLWHHAMKKLVPEIMIPRKILKNMASDDVALVIELIQLNTMLLKSNWRILRYSSLEDGKAPEMYRGVRCE